MVALITTAIYFSAALVAVVEIVLYSTICTPSGYKKLWTTVDFISFFSIKTHSGFVCSTDFWVHRVASRLSAMRIDEAMRALRAAVLIISVSRST